MARVKTLDLAIERTATSDQCDRVVGGGGFGISVGGTSVYVGGAHGYRGQGHGNYGGYGYGGYRQPAHSWHSTTHYDYHSGQLNRHGNHFHYQPGHYDRHRTGHWHHNH